MENILVTVKEINDFVRRMVSNNRKIIKLAKLPSTVMLQFIRDNNKQLTVSNLSRVAEFIGAELVVGFRDKNSGELISLVDAEKKMLDKIEASKKDHVETEKLIAGIEPAGEVYPVDNIKALAMRDDIDLNDLDPEVAKDVRDYRRQQEENDKLLKEFVKQAEKDKPPTDEEQFMIDFDEVFEELDRKRK